MLYAIGDIAATDTYLYIAKARTANTPELGKDPEFEYEIPPAIVRVKRDGTDLDLNFYEEAFEFGNEESPLAIAANDEYVYCCNRAQLGTTVKRKSVAWTPMVLPHGIHLSVRLE